MNRRLILTLLATFVMAIAACCATEPDTQPDPLNPDNAMNTDEAEAEDEETPNGDPVEPGEAMPTGEDCGPAKVDLDALPAKTLTGTLHYKAIEPRKSVEAYLGVEFTLDADGTEHVLKPTDRVSRDALIALDGKPVEVTGVLVEGSKPCSWEQYPMDMDGKPMKRPAAYHLLKANAR